MHAQLKIFYVQHFFRVYPFIYVNLVTVDCPLEIVGRNSNLPSNTNVPPITLNDNVSKNKRSEREPPMSHTGIY